MLAVFFFTIEESACVLIVQVVVETYTGKRPYAADREPKRLVRIILLCYNHVVL